MSKVERPGLAGTWRIFVRLSEASIEDDLRAKRVDALAGATLGRMTSGVWRLR